MINFLLENNGIHLAIMTSAYSCTFLSVVNSFVPSSLFDFLAYQEMLVISLIHLVLLLLLHYLFYLLSDDFILYNFFVCLVVVGAFV